MPKVRPDARLKTLPESRQAEIAAYARTHSLDDTVSWLRAAGIRTSRSALSLFLSWYALEQQLRANEDTARALVEALAREQPEWSADQLERVGQAFFAMLALQQQDVTAWARAQQIALRRDQIRLEREKVELLRRRAEQAEAAEVVTRSDLTPEAKAEKFRQIFGLA